MSINMPARVDVVVMVAASALDAVTAIATALAVLVAAWAVVSGQRESRRERAHVRLTERRASLVQLLAAMEEIQALRAPHYVDNRSELNEANEQLKTARARYLALLRASEEPLRLARQDAFSHFGYQPPEGGAPLLGNPEAETEPVMAVRAEIVSAIDDLREQISSNDRPRGRLGWRSHRSERDQSYETDADAALTQRRLARRSG